MGCLRRHELTGYIKDYGLEYYFETGTGQAEDLCNTLSTIHSKNATPWILMRTWWSIHTTNLRMNLPAILNFM